MKLLRIILALWWALAALPAHAMPPAAKAAVLYGKNPCANITLSLGLAANTGPTCLNGTRYGSPTQIPGLTFTRASSGTATTLNGTVVSFGSGVPRITDQGLLIEQAATNLVTYSQDFTNAAWVKNGGIAIATGFAAPDGTSTAQHLAAPGNIDQYIGNSFSGAMTRSLFVRGDTATGGAIGLYDTTTSAMIALLNLSWSAGVPSGSLTTGTSFSIVALNGGWYRVSVTGTAVTGHSMYEYIYPDFSGGASYAWGDQPETGPFASSYIPTTSAAVTRAADVAYIANFNNPPLPAGAWRATVIPGLIAANARIASYSLANGSYLAGSGFLLGIGTTYVEAGGFHSGINKSVTLTSGARFSFSAAYNVTTGFQSVTTPTGSVSSLTGDFTGVGVARFNIGTLGNSQQFNGYISSLSVSAK